MNITQLGTVFAAAVMLHCAGADSTVKIPCVDFSAPGSESKLFNVEKEQTEFVYDGFRLLSPSRTAWIVSGNRQKPGQATWMRGNSTAPLHTTVGIVKISPVLTEEQRAQITPELLEATLRRSFSRTNARTLTPKYELRRGLRAGVVSVEFHSESIDSGSSHSAKPLKLFTTGFMLITPKHRLLSAVVSERVARPDQPCDRKTAEAFLSAVAFDR